MSALNIETFRKTVEEYKRLIRIATKAMDTPLLRGEKVNGDSACRLETMLQALSGPDNNHHDSHKYIITDQKKIIGFATAFGYSSAFDTDGYVKVAFVHPDYRNHPGISETLNNVIGAASDWIEIVN